MSKENKQNVRAAAAGAAGGFAAAMGVQYGDDIIDGIAGSSEDEPYTPAGELSAEPEGQGADLNEAVASKVSYEGETVESAAVSEEEVINGVAADTDGNGIIDAVVYDINNDGQMDTVLLDIDQDGVFEYAGVDMNGDLVADSHFVDINGDQSYDLSINENVQEDEMVNDGYEGDVDGSYESPGYDGGDDIAMDMNNDMDTTEWA